MNPLDLSKVPNDQLLAIALDGKRDADLVGSFLNLLSETPAGRWAVKRPLPLPVDFLLGLGAALRLGFWEMIGIQVHRDAGMPAASEIIIDVLSSVTNPEAAARTAQLPSRVLALSIEHFAWAGRLELNCDVTVDPVDEDLFLEAMADFIWNNRHLAST
jgi:hypothetical protein